MTTVPTSIYFAPSRPGNFFLLLSDSRVWEIQSENIDKFVQFRLNLTTTKINTLDLATAKCVLNILWPVYRRIILFYGPLSWFAKLIYLNSDRDTYMCVIMCNGQDRLTPQSI